MPPNDLAYAAAGRSSGSGSSPARRAAAPALPRAERLPRPRRPRPAAGARRRPAGAARSRSAASAALYTLLHYPNLRQGAARAALHAGRHGLRVHVRLDRPRARCRSRGGCPHLNQIVAQHALETYPARSATTLGATVGRRRSRASIRVQPELSRSRQSVSSWSVRVATPRHVRPGLRRSRSLALRRFGSMRDDDAEPRSHRRGSRSRIPPAIDTPAFSYLASHWRGEAGEAARRHARVPAGRHSTSHERCHAGARGELESARAGWCRLEGSDDRRGYCSRAASSPSSSRARAGSA